MSYVPSYLTAPLAAAGALPLINRMVLAPLTRGRAGASRVANATIAEYYRQRAGFGLIVTEVRFPQLPVLGGSRHTQGSSHHCYDQALAPTHLSAEVLGEEFFRFRDACRGLG